MNIMFQVHSDIDPRNFRRKLGSGICLYPSEFSLTLCVDKDIIGINHFQAS